MLGAMGYVCACDDQQGRGGICKHVVAVNIALERVWHSVKNAKRRMKHIHTPKIRCHDRMCRSECYTRHDSYPKGSKEVQRYLCKKYNKTFSGTPGFKGRHFWANIIARALDDHISGKSLGAVARGLKTCSGKPHHHISMEQ